MIGVTGSIGKTSARMLITQILQQSFPHKTIYTSSKNFNGELGMSLSVLGISDYAPTPKWVLEAIAQAIFRSFFAAKMYDVIFLEYGIDHVGEMKFMLWVVHPEISLITKIDKVHSSQFENTDVTAFEKYQLVQSTSQKVYLNLDDAYAKKYESSIFAEKSWYSTNILDQEKDLTLSGKNLEVFLQDTLPKSRFDFYKNGEKKLSVSSNSLWNENVWYISIAYDIVEYLYQKWYKQSFFEKNKNTLLHTEFELQPSRFSLLQAINGNVIIDSSYNAAPESMNTVLDNVVSLQQKLYSEYEMILVLWEMRELWEYSQKEHQKLAQKALSISKNIFLVGCDMQKYVVPEFEKSSIPVKMYPNSYLLWKDLRKFLEENSQNKYLILFKWSQNTIFLEEAVKWCLANPQDEKLLCRQESFWQEKKQLFFKK